MIQPQIRAADYIQMMNSIKSEQKQLWESLTYFKWIIFKIVEIDNGKSFEVFLKDQGMNRNEFLVAIKGVNINANWWSSYTINHKQCNQTMEFQPF